MTKLSPEVQAAIIKIAGKWALGMATAPTYDVDTKKYEPTQPSQIADELQQDFESSYEFLMKYLGYSSDE